MYFRKALYLLDFRNSGSTVTERSQPCHWRQPGRVSL